LVFFFNGSRKKGPSLHPTFFASHLGIVLIKHDNNLSHVVELRDGTKISQSSLPLCILGLLSNTKRGKPVPKDEELGNGQGNRRKEKACRKKEA
jgi:hypothetical protein